MSERLVFDLEADNLYLDVSVVHCLHVLNIDTGEVTRYDNRTGTNMDAIKAGALRIHNAAEVWGHNILDYDIPTIKKFFPKFNPKGLIRDSLVLSRLIWSDSKGRGSLLDRDMRAQERGTSNGMPGFLYGTHSLKAWGYRLGVLKGHFADDMSDWAKWTQDMSDYCVQDLHVSEALRSHIEPHLENFRDSVELEHQVRRIVSRQTYYGVRFDVDKAQRLEQEMREARDQLDHKLRATLGDTVTKVGAPWTPKRDNPAKGYKAGVPIRRVYEQEVNFNSREHVAWLLGEKYNWVPEQRTKMGKAKLSESILRKMPYPEAQLLADRYMLEKTLGQLSNGAQSWLKAYRLDTGRIHGSVNTNGAVTGRMTHSSPNMAQVPSLSKGKDGSVLLGLAGGFGKECRELFTVLPGKALVGADASGLELRCLAHYMGNYDGGAYARTLLEGDIHTANQQAAGLPTRDNAKTFI